MWALVSLLSLLKWFNKKNEYAYKIVNLHKSSLCIVVTIYYYDTFDMFIVFCACAVVCFLSDRDWLRERVIQWIQAEVDSDNLATSNVSSVDDLLHMYFKVVQAVSLK